MFLLCFVSLRCNKFLLRLACSEKSGCSIASGSSLGGHSTLGNDLPSLTISEDFPADFFQDLDMSSVYGNCLMKKE